jgi:hypothetical protein
LQQIVNILLESPATVFADEPSLSDGADVHRVRLHVEGHAGASVHHEVSLRLSPLRAEPGDHAFAWQLTWEPVGNSRVLPSFAGTLDATSLDETTRLRLKGSYRPPLGAIGAIGDGLIGHRLARRAVESFLTELAARIGREAAAEVVAVGLRPAPYPTDMRDADPTPESWLG